MNNSSEMPVVFPCLAAPAEFTHGTLFRADKTGRNLYAALMLGGQGPLRFAVASDEEAACKVLHSMAAVQIGKLAYRFSVDVRRWFNGNATFHNFRIKHDGVVICPWGESRYGYDDHYKVSVHEWLIEHGWVPAVEGRAVGSWPALSEVAVHFDSVIDVKTKKELLFY